MSDLISVVVPAYNVEPYIGKCLDSVLLQTYHDLEVIVINDGSTDGTAEVIRRFTSDSRVKYIDQANAGVSAARNVGIEAAKGKYLAFVDSDDYLEPDMYAKLHAVLVSAGADIAACNYNLIYDDHEDRQYSKMRDETVNVCDDVYGYFVKYCACPKPNNYIWTRLYDAELVKRSGVRFERYRLGDDTLFNFKLLPHIHQIAVISDGLYNYFQRGDSNVYTVANKSNLAGEYADTFQALADYYKANGFGEFLSVLPIHAFTRLRSVFFYSRLAGQDDKTIWTNIVSGFKDRDIYKYLTGAVS